MKFTTIKACKDTKEANKGKHPYIDAITRGTPWENLHFKRTMKRKIKKMMAIYRKEGNTYAKILDYSMLGFRDLEKLEVFWMIYSPS